MQICFNPNINFNTINTNFNNINEKKNFLGKKTKNKVHFDIIKKEEKKPIFFSNNPISNINNIHINNNDNNSTNSSCIKFCVNNQNILNSPNSNSTEGTLINNKEIEKSDSSSTIELNMNNKMDNNINSNINNNIPSVISSFNILNNKPSKETFNTTLTPKNKKEKNDKNEKIDKNVVNEGRWSYEEHLKFIEGITLYGKNWKNVQKFVGTRTSAQARSHAQKFFLKLKTIKNNKFNFDFSNYNIKSLSDIIAVIKKNSNDKQYIMNTLKTLSDSISINDINNDSELCRSKSVEKDLNVKNKIEIPIMFNDININLNNNIKKDEKFKINNNILANKDKIKEPNINININLNNKANTNINTVNNTTVQNIPNIQVPKEETNFTNNKTTPRYIFDDGILFLVDGTEFFCMDNLSLRIKNELFVKNMRSPYLKFINTFFS
jgi:SHAQKYF class myb-like DNA-binding protein